MLSQTWYIRDSRKIEGPLSLEELRHAAASGAIRPQTLVSQSPTGGWVAAKHIANLQFGEPTTVPVPPKRVASSRRPTRFANRFGRRTVVLGMACLFTLLVGLGLWRREESTLVVQTQKLTKPDAASSEAVSHKQSPVQAAAKSLPPGTITQRWRRKMQSKP